MCYVGLFFTKDLNLWRVDVLEAVCDFGLPVIQSLTRFRASLPFRNRVPVNQCRIDLNKWYLEDEICGEYAERSRVSHLSYGGALPCKRMALHLLRSDSYFFVFLKIFLCMKHFDVWMYVARIFYKQPCSTCQSVTPTQYYRILEFYFFIEMSATWRKTLYIFTYILPNILTSAKIKISNLTKRQLGIENELNGPVDPPIVQLKLRRAVF